MAEEGKNSELSDAVSPLFRKIQNMTDGQTAEYHLGFVDGIRGVKRTDALRGYRGKTYSALYQFKKGYKAGTTQHSTLSALVGNQ